MMPTAWRWLQFVLFTTLCVGLGGCADATTKAGPHGIRVRGKAQYEKRPTAGAILIFHGTTSGLPPRAKVGSDGSFEVDADAGLVAGNYTVVVEWRHGSDENGAGQRSIVPERYTRKEASPLKVVVTQGADGSCDLGLLSIT
jgi:hypothetical protein